MSHPAPDSPYRVSFDGDFKIKGLPTRVGMKTEVAAPRLEAATRRIGRLQRKLYGDNRFSLLLVFQALDAAGKDGMIRSVMHGIDPAGCHVTAFKQPSAEELDHDFLWRVARALPERGRIGIFNRSHYEEVVVVRVHPQFLDTQRLPRRPKDLFEERFASIRDFERHLYRNGTIVVKFWLNVSKEEQRQRFLERLASRETRWKFSAGDVAERPFWKAYLGAYEAAVRETSRPWAPWYVIPADDKHAARVIVAEIVADTLANLPLHWPSATSNAEAERMRALLEAEAPGGGPARRKAGKKKASAGAKVASRDAAGPPATPPADGSRVPRARR